MSGCKRDGSEDQPRDEHGRFGSGGGEKTAANREADKTEAAKVNARIAAAAKAAGVPHDVYARAVDYVGERGAAARFPPKKGYVAVSPSDKKDAAADLRTRLDAAAITARERVARGKRPKLDADDRQSMIDVMHGAGVKNTFKDRDGNDFGPAYVATFFSAWSKRDQGLPSATRAVDPDDLANRSLRGATNARRDPKVPSDGSAEAQLDEPDDDDQFDSVAACQARSQAQGDALLAAGGNGRRQIDIRGSRGR